MSIAAREGRSAIDLEGTLAIVTGTGSPTGIGRASALALAEQGASVVITEVHADQLTDGTPAINTESMAALALEIEAFGVDALVVEVDITDRRQIDSCVESALLRFGRIDILVNNAGHPSVRCPFSTSPAISGTSAIGSISRARQTSARRCSRR